MDVEELAARVREKVAERRRELEADPKFRELQEEERFLARLESHIASHGSPQSVAPSPQLDGSAGVDSPSLRRVKAGEKGEAILALLKQHGRQQPKVLRERLRQQGIDPEAGTEVKRVLWQLAKENKLRRYAETNEYGPLEEAVNGVGTITAGKIGAGTVGAITKEMLKL